MLERMCPRGDRQCARHAIGKRYAEQQHGAGNRRQHEVLERAFGRCALALALHDQCEGRQRQQLDADEQWRETFGAEHQHAAERGRRRQQPELVAPRRSETHGDPEGAKQQHELAELREAIRRQLTGYHVSRVARGQLLCQHRQAGGGADDEDDAGPAGIDPRHLEQHQHDDHAQQQQVGRECVHELIRHDWLP
jgi:hypothetical protein